jgi:hypothetical protein
MTTTHRRQFLQSSLAAGAVLGLGGSQLSGFSPTLSNPANFAANPRVEAGKVRWHRDFAAARAAAARSGKSVLLLHMLGRLDEQHC